MTPGWRGYVPGAIVRLERGAIGLQLFERGDDGSRGVLVRMVIEDARPEAAVECEAPLEQRFHYFLGADPSRWVSDARSYSRLRVPDIVPGVELVLRAEGGRFKYDLVFEPGVDPACLSLRFEGVAGVEEGAYGALRLHTALGDVEMPAGRTFEVTPSGAPRELAARFQAIASDTAVLQVDARDPSLRLVVDPAFFWATYVGGSYDGGGFPDVIQALALDAQGDIVAAGSAGYPGFPITPGAYVNYPSGNPDAGTRNIFVAKFDRRTSALRWASMLGGSNVQQDPEAIALDGQGRPTVGGWTFASDFPTTPGAYDRVKNALGDAGFVFRLTADGSGLVFSTLLDSTRTLNSTEIHALAVAGSGATLVTGWTSAPNFPTTPGAFDSTIGWVRDAFVTRLDPTGSSLEWSTYLGGNEDDKGVGIALDGAENVTIAGSTNSTDFPVTPGAYDTGPPTSLDTFVTRLRSDGSALLWSTLLGGSGEDEVQDMALQPDGSVVVGGRTLSLDYPVTPGAFQPTGFYNDVPFFDEGFVSRLDPSGSRLLGSTYFGSPGIGFDQVNSVTVDVSGLVTIAGSGANVIVTPGAFDTTYNTGFDWFVTRFDPAMRRVFYSTYVGGAESEFVLDSVLSTTGRLTAGGASHGLFPVTPGAFDTTYNGGQTDGVLVSMDLYLRGVESISDSQPSCLGPLAANVTAMPSPGSPDFGFVCSAAPPDATGWLVVARIPAGSTTFPFGALRPHFASAVFPVSSDRNGYVERASPELVASSGARYLAQFLFRNPPSCTTASLVASSNVLAITVQ